MHNNYNEKAAEDIFPPKNPVQAILERMYPHLNFIQVEQPQTVSMSVQHDPSNFDTCQKAEDYDVVNKPKHYNHNRLGIECIQAMEASMTPEEFLGYLKGAAFKYLWRYRYKNNPIQDLDKAEWYIKLLKEKYGAFKETQTRH